MVRRKSGGGCHQPPTQHSAPPLSPHPHPPTQHTSWNTSWSLSWFLTDKRQLGRVPPFLCVNRAFHLHSLFREQNKTPRPKQLSTMGVEQALGRDSLCSETTCVTLQARWVCKHAFRIRKPHHGSLPSPSVDSSLLESCCPLVPLTRQRTVATRFSQSLHQDPALWEHRSQATCPSPIHIVSPSLAGPNHLSRPRPLHIPRPLTWGQLPIGQ